MKKRLISLVLACLMLVAVMLAAGCGEKNDLETIKDKGVIVWGTNAEFAPFETKDSAGNVIGIDAVIAAKIAEKLGVSLQVEDMEFNSLPAALQSGKIDFIAAGYSANDEREETMDFTSKYFVASQVVMVQDGNSEITTADALVGKRIGVQNATTGDIQVASNIQDAEVSRYATLMLAAQDLANGKLDAVIGDNLPSLIIIKNIEGIKILDDVSYDDEDYVLAVRKGQTELLEVIDGVLMEMLENGEIDAAREKYSSLDD